MDGLISAIKTWLSHILFYHYREYLALIDCSGRAMGADKRGAIEEENLRKFKKISDTYISSY